MGGAAWAGQLVGQLVGWAGGRRAGVRARVEGWARGGGRPAPLTHTRRHAAARERPSSSSAPPAGSPEAQARYGGRRRLVRLGWRAGRRDDTRLGLGLGLG